MIIYRRRGSAGASKEMSRLAIRFRLKSHGRDTRKDYEKQRQKNLLNTIAADEQCNEEGHANLDRDLSVPKNTTSNKTQGGLHSR